MPRDLAMRLAMIVYSPEIVAIRHRSESAVQRKNFQSVTGQVEIADDLRPQKRHDVRAHRELKSRADFFGTGRAGQDVAALEHENFPAGLGQVGGGGQTVVASADDDYVVLGTVCNRRHSAIQMAGETLRK